jgi:hypothetical protein
MIPVSLLNFLSGLAAGAGINLLTSIEGGSTASPHRIIVDSAFWVIVAAGLAYAAHLAETVERGVSLVIDGNLSEAERREVYAAQAGQVRFRYRLILGISGVLTILSIVLIPGL